MLSLLLTLIHLFGIGHNFHITEVGISNNYNILIYPPSSTWVINLEVELGKLMMSIAMTPAGRVENIMLLLLAITGFSQN